MEKCADIMNDDDAHFNLTLNFIRFNNHKDIIQVSCINSRYARLYIVVDLYIIQQTYMHCESNLYYLFPVISQSITNVVCARRTTS